MPIPPSGLKFCQSGKPTADFHVAAECSEPDRSETLLFGSEQFYAVKDVSFILPSFCTKAKAEHTTGSSGIIRVAHSLDF